MRTRSYTVDDVRLNDGRPLGRAVVTVYGPDDKSLLPAWIGDLYLSCDADVENKLRSTVIVGDGVIETNIGPLFVQGVSGGCCSFKGKNRPAGALLNMIDMNDWLLR